jgi:hypothetical protein
MPRPKRTTGHGPGRGKISLSCTIPVDIHAQLQHLAQQSGLTRAGYAARAIIRAVERTEVVSEHVDQIRPLTKDQQPPTQLAG